MRSSIPIEISVPSPTLLKRIRGKIGGLFYRVLDFYENCVAIFLAKYCWWLYFPLFLFYQRKSFCFLMNVAEGVGHILPEVDYFFRLQYLQQVDPSRKYIFLRKKDPLSIGFISLYHHKFYQAQTSTWKYLFLLPMLIHFKEITLDCGYCRIKWQLPHAQARYDYHPKHPFAYQITKGEGIQKFALMMKLRSKTNSFFPLLDMSQTSDALLQKLSLTRNQFCLVHIKTNVCNATACKTDPKTYLDSLYYLKEKGYQLVFAGREKMPVEFQDLHVLNYAQSPLASFANDLLLSEACALFITGGSGINMLGDYLDKPVLYLNSWHLALQFFHRTSVCVPALIQKKDRSSLLSFQEQVDLALMNPREIREIFPSHLYQAVNASAEDIYQGLMELFDVIQYNTPKDPLYEKYVQACNRYDFLSHCESRISSHFLRKHQNLLTL